VIVAALLPASTVAASTFIYDAPADSRVDTRAFAASAVGLSQLKGAQEASASLSVEFRGTSTTSRTRSHATEAVDDVFRAPGTSINRHGQLTNGTYTIDAAGMAPHKTGSLASGKSQWWSVDAERAALDAAAYADANGLWVGAKAKVPATNGTVGVLGRTGEPTEWINVYRNANGFVHGAPGGAG
jgi:hypothetical protein